MKFAWVRRNLPAFGLGLLVGIAIGVHLWRCNPFHHPRGGNPTSRIVERFSRDLKLTPDQKTRLAAILEKTHDKMTALQAKSGADFQAIQKETATAIEKILTKDQLPVFIKMEKKHIARMQKRGHGPMDACPPPPEKP